METLDVFLRTQIDLLQYAAFFAALVFFGVLERFWAVRRGTGARRQRWPANFGMTMLNIVVLGAIPVSGVLVADYALAQGFGLLNVLQIAALPAFLIGILLRSLLSWLIHWAMHKVPFLWRVHRVHHTDRFIDISTTVRFHPLEFLISTPIIVLSILTLGISPVALLFSELFDTVMAIFTHANVKLPRVVERMLGWVLVTPAIHRIHHSSWQPETDSNYGATLSVWDRLFGTYRRKDAGALAAIDLGLSEHRGAEVSSIPWLLLLPFRPLRRLQGERS